MNSKPSLLSSPKATQAALAAILLLSGFCSLVYQTVWLREFRLVFGGAAPAAAAVVAVFMAGLGFGGKFFGGWVEKVGRPFRFYARLEIGIALAAMASPVMLGLARTLYLKTGGTAGMGLGAATCLQLLMTALVLGLPCFLMGGTLPAAMKFAQRDDDPRRSITAFFYGINIAGAVSGALLSTFWLLPSVGNRSTLIIAVLANLVIALVAGLISMREEKEPRETAPVVEIEEEIVSAKAPTPFVLAAAFMSGFTFFVVELVWYRMSTPLLGGSVYGFGLVLCVVLAGMGLGGLLYSMILKKAEPSIAGFTLVSALQAFAVLLPWALGDRIAHLALVMNNSLRALGLVEMAAGWAVVMGLLAFLPSLLSGIQFPLLVSLLGRGNVGVGRQLGRAYLWNTFGSISGSLLGGFVLVPLMGLVNCWLVIGLLIAMMSAASLWIQSGGVRASQQSVWTLLGQSKLATAGLAACLAFALLAQGPTAVWQHSPIGYGRVKDNVTTALGLETWQRETRRSIVSAYDGRETTVAVVGGTQYCFLTNGKSDGSAVSDAGTQVMLGIVGAILHPNPRNACVVGLGTGTTSGWLADVPGMQRVDTLELEEEIRKVAQYFEPVTRNAMKHPRVNNITGDAREFLLTKGENYDLIVSEPSNPCRAGVANLYTREFYENASQRLTHDGIFCQWLQGYEVDPDTISTVIATLHSVFPKVEVWSTQSTDMLLVCAKEDKPWPLASIRQRIQMNPMKEALNRFWETDSAEGFLASCLANSDYCAALALNSELPVNSDDMNRLEFSFALSVAKDTNCPYDLTKAATAVACQMPKVDGQIDSLRYDAERLHLPLRLWKSATSSVLPGNTPAQITDRLDVLKAYQKNDFATYLKAPPPAVSVWADHWRTALAKSQTGAADAETAIAQIESVMPLEAQFLRAITADERRHAVEYVTHLQKGFEMLQKSPWCQIDLVARSLKSLPIVTKARYGVTEQALAKLFVTLGEKYPVDIALGVRHAARIEMAMHLPIEARLSAVKSLGLPYPWHPRALVLRANAFLQTNDPRADEAMADLNRFIAQGGKIGGETPPFVIPSILEMLEKKPAQAQPMVLSTQPAAK
ncbi:MAG: fused MFS/spermidine synthase [Verrucomicrobiaceae bacterium]|nr:fused MFS/spermidine synthase [Verrucomicrobiaceae bacterium]